MRDHGVVISLVVAFVMVAAFTAGAFAQDNAACEALAFNPFELTSVGDDGDPPADKAAEKAAKKALKAEQKAQKRADKAEQKAQKQADKAEQKEQKAQDKAIRKALRMMLLGAKRRAYPPVISHRPGLRSPMRPPL